MPNAEVSRLEALGFQWSLLNLAWDEKYALLEAFKEQKAHCNVPRDYVVKDVKLGRWVKTQRVLYRLRHVAEAECNGRLPMANA